MVRKKSSFFRVGVVFENQNSEHHLRMVEQVCHIEYYRKQQAEDRGRKLSSEEAAQEWVALYAADFP